MATTTAQFKARFPEFASVDDARVQLFLDDAALVMDESVWLSVYDTGQAYLAAHYLAMGTRSGSGGSGGSGGVSGPVTGKTVEGVSTSYGSSQAVGGAGSATAGYYNLTQYGQRYLVLLKNLGAMASVV